MPVKFRSRLAGTTLRALFKSPLAGCAERGLVWLGHQYPYRLPARGSIVGQLAQRKVGKELVGTLICGGKISVPPITEGVGVYLSGSLVEDEETTNLLFRALRAGDVFFDVGANMGFYTLLAAARCGPSSRIYAFEPQPSLVEHLMKSVSLNGYEDRVTVEQVAVEEEHSGRATLFFAEDKECTGIPSIFSHEWLDAKSGLAIPTVSIDGYVRDKGIRRIDVLKIDIEGAEMLALRGMKGLLKASPPDLLILEVSAPALSWPQFREGRPLLADPDAAKPLEVVSFLRGYGYEPWQIRKDGRLASACTQEALQNLTWRVNLAFVSPNMRQSRPGVFAT